MTDKATARAIAPTFQKQRPCRPLRRSPRLNRLWQRDEIDPGLGLFAQLPLECRQSVYIHYFANAFSTIKMIPKDTNQTDSDRHYRYSYLLQPYDRELLLVSHSIREEAIPYHQPPELVLNNLDLERYGMLDVRWDIPKRLMSKATTIVAQVDLSRKRKRKPEIKPLDHSIEESYPSGRRMELRMILPDDQVAHWCQNKSFTKTFKAQVWQGMYDQDVLRVFKDWLSTSRWGCRLMHDVGPERPRCHCQSSGCSCKGKGVEVLLDVECWRSSEIKDQGHSKPAKALHFIFDLKSEHIVDRYIANRPLTDTVGIWDSFGKYNQRAWQKIEVEPPKYPWDDPTHPLY